jgi:hypothetical protein
MAAEPAELKRLKKRCDDAYTRESHRKRFTDDLYRYVIPWRQHAEAIGQGAARTAEIYDTTAPTAAFRFAGRMQRDLTPPFQSWFNLKPGPFITDTAQKKKLTEELEPIAQLVKGMIRGSNFDLSSHELYMELFGGQAAMLMLEIDEMPFVRFYVVPETQVAMKTDGFGTKTGVYWKTKVPAGDIEGHWQDAKIADKELAKLAKEKPEEPVELVQASEFNRATKRWDFTVYWPTGKTTIATKSTRLCPWLTPSFYRVPGEDKGIGPGLITMGATKTANKAREFALKAAAFALLGLWTYRNDGVFNQATSPMLPGAFWKVQANDGPFGPSITRLDTPRNFDVSMFVLEDLRNEIKQGSFDDTLPPDSGSVRSPTEILERMKRLVSDLAGAYGRLNRELVTPIVAFLIDIASRRFPNFPKLDIDELLISIEIVSPIAFNDMIASIEATIRWLELMLSTGGMEVVMLNARIETLFADLGRMLGVPEKHIRSDDEKRELQEVAAAMMAQQQQNENAVAAAKTAKR